jgi:broad specificity phosphatase PhoE
MQETDQKLITGPVLYLARHGETDYNRKKIFQGRSDIPLNERGMEQAESVRQLLSTVPFTRAFVSPLERARITADIILLDHDIPQMVESRLTEINFGEWDGTPEAVVRERWMEDYMDYRNDMYSFHPENGESARDAQKRGGEWWEEIKNKFNSPEEHILVVAHQSLNAVLACYIVGISLTDAWGNFKTKPGEVVKIVTGPVPQTSRIMPDV